MHGNPEIQVLIVLAKDDFRRVNAIDAENVDTADAVFGICGQVRGRLEAENTDEHVAGFQEKPGHGRRALEDALRQPFRISRRPAWQFDRVSICVIRREERVSNPRLWWDGYCGNKWMAGWHGLWAMVAVWFRWMRCSSDE